MNNRFDEAASTWDAKPSRLEMAEKFAGAMKKILSGKTFKNGFEYGCGTGNVSFLINDILKYAVLADASQGMIDMVKEKIQKSSVKHFTPIVLNLEENSLDKKFDIIYTLMALHHVKNVETVIQKFTSMLTNEGMLIIGDLEKEDGDFHPFPENMNVHHGFEKDKLNQILEKYNFSIKNYSVFHTMTRTHTGKEKSYPLFILVASRNKS